MSFKKQLIFTDNGDGTVTCEATGFTGSACEVAAKPFKEALGGKVIASKKKPEFYQKTVADTKLSGGAS